MVDADVERISREMGIFDEVSQTLAGRLLGDLSHAGFDVESHPHLRREHFAGAAVFLVSQMRGGEGLSLNGVAGALEDIDEAEATTPAHLEGVEHFEAGDARPVDGRGAGVQASRGVGGDS